MTTDHDSRAADRCRRAPQMLRALASDPTARAAPLAALSPVARAIESA